MDISHWFDPRTRDVREEFLLNINIVFFHHFRKSFEGISYAILQIFFFFSIKIRHHIDPITHCSLPYTPHGRFIHIAPAYPSSDFANDFGIPWWKDEKYKIGVLSKKVRSIRILNILTLQDQIIEVNFHFLLN